MGIRNENYIVITGWMINELALKPNELLVYALIHGFCQDGKSAFIGGIKYIMEWTKLTKQTCISILKTLREKRYIERRIVYDTKSNNFLGYEYFTLKSREKKSEESKKNVKNDKNTEKMNDTGQNSLPAESKNLTFAGQIFFYLIMIMKFQKILLLSVLK